MTGNVILSILRERSVAAMDLLQSLRQEVEDSIDKISEGSCSAALATGTFTALQRVEAQRALAATAAYQSLDLSHADIEKALKGE